MEYEGRICRGPMERASYMLPISVGCSYNACRFCMLFRHLTYRELPLEQIEQELDRVKSAGGAPQTVYLGDGNAFGADQARLLRVIESVRGRFPGVKRFNMDATVTDIAKKSDAELRELASLGVDRLYLGVETGLDDVLAFMNKDHRTMAEAERQIARLRAAGMSWAAHIMTGVAGHGRGEENAAALAAFLNRTRPAAIVNFSLFLHRRAPLWRDVEAGRFAPASEQENLREQHRLLELLESEDCDFDGMLDMIQVRVRGRLMRDKAKMLRKSSEAAARFDQEPEIFSIVP